MNKLINDLQFRVYTTILKKSGKGKQRRIRGYASTSSLDRQNEVISIEALQQAANHLLENHTVFYEHEHAKFPVGKVIETAVDDKGLLVEVEISQTADQLWTLIEEEILNSFSIGGRVTASEEKVGEDNKPYNEITGIDLYEVSVVGLPAQPEAKFELVNKSFSMAITEEIEKRKEGSGMEKEIKKIEDKSDEKVEDALADSQKKDLKKYEAEDKAKASEAEKEKVETTTTSEGTTVVVDDTANGATTVEYAPIVVEETKVEGEPKVEEKQEENVEIEKKDEAKEEKVAEAKAELVEKVEESVEAASDDTSTIQINLLPDKTEEAKEEKSEEVIEAEKPTEEKIEEKPEEKTEIEADNSIVTDEEFDKLDTVDISKPYPNEHAARVRPVSDFQEGSFRSQQIAEGIRIIIGRLIGETTTTAQSYRFHVDHFTAEEAKQWLKDHDVTYILFEPAKQEDSQPEKKEEAKTEGTQVRVLTEEKVLELLKQLNDKIDVLSEKINAIEVANQAKAEEKVAEKPEAEEKKEEPKVEKKIEKAEEKLEEKPQRKSFIADAPYANDKKKDEEKKDVKKTTDKGWTRIVYGR